METLPWYKSAIVRQQIAAFLIAALGLFKITTDIDIDATLTTVFACVAALIPVWTIITRIFKPAPNLTQKAVQKEIELVAKGDAPASPTGAASKQGGFFQLGSGVGIVLLAIMPLVCAHFIAGCVSTQAAYKAAPLHGEAIVDTAYVLAEHYDAILIEANSLKDSGGVPSPIVEQMRAADRIARPIFLGNPATQQPGLMQLRSVYVRFHDGSSEEALQAAMNDAAKALADLINAVKTARGTT